MKKNLFLLSTCLLTSIAVTAQVQLSRRECTTHARDYIEPIEIVPMGQRANAPTLDYNQDYEGVIYLENFEEADVWSVSDAAEMMVAGGLSFPGVRAADGQYYLLSEPYWEARDARATSPQMELENTEQYYVSIYAYTPGYAAYGYELKDEFRILARNVDTEEETVVIDYSGENARVFDMFTKVEGTFTPTTTGVYEFVLHLCTQEIYVENVAFDRFAIGTSPDPYVFDPPVLLPTPEGEQLNYLLNYTHSAYGNADILSKVVFGKNDTVYVRGLSTDIPRAWMYGIKQGDKIAFPSGQYVGAFAGLYDVFMQGGKDFVVNEINGEQRWGYIPTDTVYMAIKGDTICTIEGEGFVENACDMVTGDLVGALGFIVDYKYHPFAFNNVAPDVTENTPILYHMSADVLGSKINTNRLTDVVIDGDKMYIKGVSLDTPEGWICGTIKDNTVVFPTHQYMGLYENFFPVFFEAVNIDTTTMAIEKLDEYVMDYVDGVLTSRTPYMLTQDGINYSYGIMNLKLSPFVLKPATPAAPVWVEYQLNMALESYYVYFVYQLVDVEGDFILPENLYYRIYFDDELFTFAQPDYPYVDAPTTDMSVNFIDDWSFNRIGETSLMVSIRPLDFEFKKVAVEMVYKVDGEERVSERTEFVRPDAAIDDVKADKEIAREIYTNLQGIRVDSDTKGFVIKTIVYTDGTIENIKMLNND